MHSIFLSFAVFACVPQSTSKHSPSPSKTITIQESLQRIVNTAEPSLIPKSKMDTTLTEVWTQHCSEQQQDEMRQKELQTLVVEKDGVKMRYSQSRKGERPLDGYPLYIALHGGGGAPASVNDQQWNHRNQVHFLWT